MYRFQIIEAIPSAYINYLRGMVYPALMFTPDINPGKNNFLPGLKIQFLYIKVYCQLIRPISKELTIILLDGNTLTE